MEALITRMAEFVEGESEPGFADIASLTATLEKKRVIVNPAPKTLQQICIKCIINNKGNFLSASKTSFFTGLHSPFANLPNWIVQDLLEAIFEDKKHWSLDFTSKRPAEIFCFVLQLLNPLVLEFDFDKFDFFGIDSKMVTIFRHILQNCPRIQKIKVNSTVWKDINVLPRVQHVDLFETMALRWLNLTHLELEFTAYVQVEGRTKYDDRVLQKVSKCFTNLTDLVIHLGDLTLNGSTYISELQKLKNLHLVFDTYAYNASKELMSAIVQAAGGAPSLENFVLDFKTDFDDENNDSEAHANFVDMYGKMFGKKKLFIKQIRLNDDLEHKWPECLSVEELHLSIQNIVVPLLNILSANFTVQKLHIKHVPLNTVYALVEKFGSTLTHLTIKTPLALNKFDPFRIISACSKLEHVRFLISGDYYYPGSSNYEVSAHQFRNCSYFKLRRYDDYDKVVAEICDLHKMFLLGSKKIIQELKVESEPELETLLWALNQEQQTCLDRVQDVSVKFQITTYPIMSKIIQLVLLLAERSPFLKSVSLREQNRVDYPPRWFRNVLQKLDISLENTQSLINESDSEGPGYSDYEYDDGSNYS